jgi:D-erythrulose 4-kinase
MSHIVNDPDNFVEEMIDGFAAASERWVRRVPGGVVRSAPAAPGSVAVVIGGGSGHYPAFAGLVGSGIAHGAALGNIFASPAASQIWSVARSCEAGGGVLFSYGNYAGDMLNFDEAQDRLRADGIDCVTVTVTDDISSAPPGEEARRRGIAGGLVVFKAAGAAADAGADLGTVTRIARRANERVRSIGVAFGGCTLPGAAEPLFTVPAGRMGVGLGVHGEPGLYEEDIASADSLADLMTAAVLAEAPPDASERVCVLVNGLGSVKYEELFVLYRTVHARLRTAGLEPVDPEVGELVTSFEMAGVSLTICWLDDELEQLWRAPADCPGYRKAGTQATAPYYAPSSAPVTVTHTAGLEGTRPQAAEAAPASAASASAGDIACQALATAAAALHEHADELGRLDSVAGDGDHGIGMARGAKAASSAARQARENGAGLRTVIRQAGRAWADEAGGTSGALWGAALTAMADQFSDASAPSPVTLAASVRAATAAIADRGHAVLGDKTMLDALIPFRDCFASDIAAGRDPRTALEHAAQVSEEAARATAALLPRIGRARPHAERSRGTPDPGAISLALVARAVLPRATPG